MHNLELLLEEKEQYENSKSGRDIISKQKVIKNIETLIAKIDDDMIILEKELFFQKKKINKKYKVQMIFYKKQKIIKIITNKKEIYMKKKMKKLKNGIVKKDKMMK